LNIKATFFVIGYAATQYPDLLRRAYSEGHEIALHTWSHPELSKLTDGQVVAQLIWAARAIKDVIGVTPAIMRPPYGDTSARTRQILNALGLSIVQWVLRFYLVGLLVETYKCVLESGCQ
jgi:peptidoglycan/xylan/chitin deacetylase (PgdA/CDA1 family)